MIFPVTASQSNGIEDARFVEFDEAPDRIYYATYTAYSGRAIRSELIETRDFLSFRMTPLQGAAAQNKGMALFPAQARRPIRHDRPAGQREPLSHPLGRPASLGRRPAPS